jgi:diguanylate cyclase (GGDEF)-like protein/PAS domain S-box-containing protein
MEGNGIKKPIKVLIAKDSEDDAALLIESLQHGGFDPAYEIVEKPKTMADNLNQQSWDVVISDRSMSAQLLDSANDSIILHDFEGIIHYANDVACRLYGYTREELMQKRVFDLAVGESTEENQFRLNELKTKGSIIFDAVFGKDGALTPVEINAKVLEVGGRQLVMSVARDITERKRMEKELQLSEQKYRTIFNSTGTASIAIEADTTISLINREFEIMSGYSKEETEGKKSWKEFIVGDRLAEMVGYHNLRRTDPDSAPKQYETEFLTRKGGIRQVIVTVSMITGTSQSIAFILDISGIKQAEEATRQSESNFRTLFEDAPIGVATSRTGRMLTANRACLAMFGYTSNTEIAGISLLKHIAPQCHSQVEVYLNAIVRSGEQGKEAPSKLETVGLRKDGSQFPFEIETANIELSDRPTIIGYFTDITERKITEEELLASEERYRTVFDINKTAMVISEEDMTISLINAETEKFIGYSKEETEGKMKWTEFIPDGDRERMAEYHRLRRIDPDAVPKEYEWRLISKNRGIRDVSMLVAMIPGTKKSVASFLDVTDRKEAERKIQAANEQLVRLVRELEERNAETSQLSEMGEQFQSCQNTEEACAIGAQYIQKLFPDYTGALCMINPSRDLVEAIEMWGDPAPTSKVFDLTDCWALRRGRPQLVDDAHPGVLCGHITGSQAGQYLCVPMMAHGEALGTLHLYHTTPELDQQRLTERLYSEHNIQLAMAIADQIALALADLKLREKLRQQAIRDILTGVFNRRYMEETLERELCRAERNKSSVGVIMLDIDHFKEYNDILGHAGGDALLHELGGMLNKSIRGGDIVSRYGGEEFLVVLPDATLEITRKRAEELRQAAKGLQVYYLDKPPWKITLSLGVAAFPEHGRTIEEILKSADTALYRAKKEGRDRVVVA